MNSDAPPDEPAGFDAGTSFAQLPAYPLCVTNPAQEADAVDSGIPVEPRLRRHGAGTRTVMRHQLADSWKRGHRGNAEMA